MKAAQPGRREGVSPSGLERSAADCLECHGAVMCTGFKDKVLLVVPQLMCWI